MTETLNTEQTVVTEATEDLLGELYAAVATNEDDYLTAKREAKASKDAADQAVALRYFEEAEEPNVEELAEVFGKSVAFATATAKDAGVELSTGKRGRPSKFTTDEQEAIAQEFANAKDKFAQMELALRHRVAVETIKGWAIKHGFVTVKTRTKASS